MFDLTLEIDPMFVLFLDVVEDSRKLVTSR